MKYKRFFKISFSHGIQITLSELTHFYSPLKKSEIQRFSNIGTCNKNKLISLTILTGENYNTNICKNRILAASDYCFHIHGVTISSFTIQSRVQMFKQVDSSNRRKWTVASFNSFYGKMWVGFFLKHRKILCFWGFILKSTKRAWAPLKMALEIVKVILCLSKRDVFMWQSLGILNVFTTLYLKQGLWKTKIFLKKLYYC